jgi:uncharacterized SAM-binding protein YcdF (DUF218 family)
MRRLLAWLVRLGAACLLLVALYTFAVALIILQQARHDEAAPAQAIVVLGAAVFGERPSPVYQARLDHALTLYRQGYAPHLALTGGVGDGDTISEAEVGRNYLLAQGVSAQVMLLETTSHTTDENLQNLLPLFARESITTVVIISDGFHLLRAKSIATHLGLCTFVSPAAHSRYEPYSSAEIVAVLREVWFLSGFWLRRIMSR